MTWDNDVKRYMPFGKHKGQNLRTIPRNYLKWALRTLDTLSAGLRDDITSALRGVDYTLTDEERMLALYGDDDEKENALSPTKKQGVVYPDDHLTQGGRNDI